MKKNVLVFPCGSEIGLEVYRQLANSIHFNAIGASSAPDHGKFVYENYVEGVPFVDDDNFIDAINAIVEKHHIDFIVPAHDSIVLKLAQHRADLKCPVMTSPEETCVIARSKKKTYEVLHDVILTPEVYTLDTIKSYPVFLKPDVGQGSRGCVKANSLQEVKAALEKNPSLLILEFLPNKEYTIDCFTNRKGELLFAKGRQRARISNGISVNSKLVNDERFFALAQKINKAITFRGAWFFQVKERANGELVLMEIAPRIAGTMGLEHGAGVNFVQLSLFDLQDIDVSVFANTFNIEIDRALQAKYRTDLDYDTVYLDLDDTLILGDKVNTQMMQFVYQCQNENKQVILLSKHNKNIDQTLNDFCIDKRLFSQIIHIAQHQKKSDYIKGHTKSIFIDDSFAERKDVFFNAHIPVFEVTALDVLLH